MEHSLQCVHAYLLTRAGASVPHQCAYSKHIFKGLP